VVVAIKELADNRSPTPELGIIEGYYGRAWSWPERAQVISNLAPHGYRFYLYAPKAAQSLRRGWRAPIDREEIAAISAFAQHCRALGVRFGVGLSPHEFDDSGAGADWTHLTSRLASFDAMGIDDLAILFDDIPGDDPKLAQRQADLVAFASMRTRAGRLFVCPSYYSDDPVLDRFFGARPPDYLPQLGRLLDPAIAIFWTGEEVCSREYGPAHLKQVAQMLGRLPVLWDNYPVNDGQRMSKHLHLRGFTGRPASNASLLRAHAINPALQPILGCIAAITLAERYRIGDEAYAYGIAMAKACRLMLGDGLDRMVQTDLIALQDTGLDRLGPLHETLRDRYAGVDHSAAREIVQWLDGKYQITDEIVRTQ
jgi:hyaluronoglucosaminidase